MVFHVAPLWRGRSPTYSQNNNTRAIWNVHLIAIAHVVVVGSVLIHSSAPCDRKSLPGNNLFRVNYGHVFVGGWPTDVERMFDSRWEMDGEKNVFPIHLTPSHDDLPQAICDSRPHDSADFFAPFRSPPLLVGNFLFPFDDDDDDVVRAQVYGVRHPFRVPVKHRPVEAPWVWVPKKSHGKCVRRRSHSGWLHLELNRPSWVHSSERHLFFFCWYFATKWTVQNDPRKIAPTSARAQTQFICTRSRVERELVGSMGLLNRYPSIRWVWNLFISLLAGRIAACHWIRISSRRGINPTNLVCLCTSIWRCK